MSKLFGEVFPQICGKQAHGKTNVLVVYGGVSKQPDWGKADRTTTRYKRPLPQSWYCTAEQQSLGRWKGCLEHALPETETNTFVSFYSMRVYWRKINSKGLGVFMASNLPDYLATLVIWPRQMRVLVFQSQLQILTHITWHTVFLYRHMCGLQKEYKLKRLPKGSRGFRGGLREILWSLNWKEIQERSCCHRDWAEDESGLRAKT